MSSLMKTPEDPRRKRVSCDWRHNGGRWCGRQDAARLARIGKPRT